MHHGLRALVCLDRVIAHGTGSSRRFINGAVDAGERRGLAGGREGGAKAGVLERRPERFRAADHVVGGDASRTACDVKYHSFVVACT